MEHIQHPQREGLARFGKLGIVISVQPNSIVADASIVKKRLGAKRAQTTYPFRDMLDGGVVLAFGSYGDMGPIRGIYNAVTRISSDGKYAKGWHPEQNINRRRGASCIYLRNGVCLLF